VGVSVALRRCENISPSTNGRRAKEKPPGVGGLSYFHFNPAAQATTAKGSNNQSKQSPPII